MVAWVTKDFGGMIPRQDPRLLPDNMAEVAENVDLAGGPLDGLVEPEFIINLTGTVPYEVRKAYRFPGPATGNPDVWLPLPSEYSSVVRSPLANDTLHRIYWTNPQGQPAAGAYWNTYDRIAAGGIGANAHYNIGFIAPDPGIVLTVGVTGGTVPTQSVIGATVTDLGSGYFPGDTLGVVGGTTVPGQPPSQWTIASTTGSNFDIVSGGSSGTDGSGVTIYGTTGDGSLALSCTISGGVLVSIDGVIQAGIYTDPPLDPTNEPVSGGGLVGATIYMDMGPYEVDAANSTAYTTPPGNPVLTTCTGPGTGCTLSISYLSNDAPPYISRSYTFTYINQYGEESSPCTPSAVIDGPSDATWVVSGLPTGAPPSPAGKNYPVVTNMRLYRTIVGTSTGAQFFDVTDVSFGSSVYTDTLPDTSIVSNNLLESTSWAPPVDDLDGLISMPGGMLIGFSKNTLHFCEQNRSHAWPAGYDQSLLYKIVGLAVWQQSLVVLTAGYPSMGAGTSPLNILFQQVQAPEPCIARGSIVTDLAGVYYSSQNGLIMLSYFGMTNQTLSNMTRNIWLTKYFGADLIACRHRTQYLAINGVDRGFLIDYSEQRMGVVSLSTFLDAVSVWNDVYTGDAYICADQKIYLWDAPTFDTGAGTTTILRCTFTAANDTNLEDYNFLGDTNAHFFNIGGPELRVENNMLPTADGVGVYGVTAVPDKADYTVSFSVVLPSEPVETGNTIWVAARSSGSTPGYQAMVRYDDTIGYTISLNVGGTSVSRSIVAGALSSETELDFMMTLSGFTISLVVTRKSDGARLTDVGGWVGDPTAVAFTLTDYTYALPGVILIGAAG